MMPRLLISVRDASEAVAALTGGADLIDVKEPANGPLGRADSPVIESIVNVVAGRVPVSAAFGELELRPAALPGNLAFIKFGLAGWRGRDWPSAWERVRAQLSVTCAPVAVAYADWLLADAPPPEEVAAIATERRFGAFLIDTFEKNGATLLDRMPMDTIAGLTRRCQSAGVPVALAGSLGLAEIEQLRELAPDWFAVRGAACRRGRGSSIDETLVRELSLAVGLGQPPNYPTTQPPALS
jgi:uncharacterized protein (UPF0264 family)